MSSSTVKAIVMYMCEQVYRFTKGIAQELEVLRRISESETEAMNELGLDSCCCSLRLYLRTYLTWDLLHTA